MTTMSSMQTMVTNQNYQSDCYRYVADGSFQDDGGGIGVDVAIGIKGEGEDREIGGEGVDVIRTLLYLRLK
ncbi:hypothetical protein QR98_0089350 [Sarcoptes scabiei]|uniref:Uncharacterized protein n=1 Tax=Sarcoptes scabiei TaxID=52283 RepID=A0A132AIU5_SARSC|nr:hypothetical protein QR98_0089350 [Sarcoptes scabiei]